MQDSFSHIEGDFYILIFISTYVHLAKSADPGQAPQLRLSLQFNSHEKGILRTVKTGPMPDHGLHCLQTQVFPIILSIYTDDGHLVNKRDSDQAPHDATPGLYLTKQCRT